MLVRIPWKIIKLPSQNSMLGHHRPASETPFNGTRIPSPLFDLKKNVDKVGPPPKKLSGSAYDGRRLSLDGLKAGNQSNYEPVSCKMYKLACAPTKDSDQPAHPRSLIRAFDGRSMGNKGLNVSSGGKTMTLIRLCGCVDWWEQKKCKQNNESNNSKIHLDKLLKFCYVSHMLEITIFKHAGSGPRELDFDPSLQVRRLFNCGSN